MTIRLATSKDKEKLLKLFDEFNDHLKGNSHPSKVGGQIYDEIMERKDTEVFVAEENDELLGLATFYLLPNVRHGWHRGHIEDFFVTSSARGKQVGTQIFNFIKEYCKKHNIKVIKLDSGNELLNAHKFYEKNGGVTSERFFRFDLE